MTPPQIDRQQTLPRLGGPKNVGRCGNRGVVHEHIHAAEAIAYRRLECPELLGITDVRFIREQIGGIHRRRGHDGFRRALESIYAQIGDAYIEAHFAKSNGCRQSDTGCTAGYHRNRAGNQSRCGHHSSP